MEKFQFGWLTGIGSKIHKHFCLKGGGDFKKTKYILGVLKEPILFALSQVQWSA